MYLVIIHDQQVPVRQFHFPFLHRRFLHIHRDVERTSPARLAFHLDGAAHGLHNMLGNGQAQPGACRFLNPGMILPDKGFENPVF